jgi:hypothetical protein
MVVIPFQYKDGSSQETCKVKNELHLLLCHMVFNVTMVTFRTTQLMNKWTNVVMVDGWVHPLAKTTPSFVNNLWWNIVMDGWNLDESHLISDSNCNTINLYSPQKIQGMTNNVWLTFSVGGTIPRFIISIDQDK